jgi:hypothetical protein
MFVDMDVVGVMAAYLPLVRVCTALSREARCRQIIYLCICWVIKCINFNNIHPSMRRSSKWSLSLRFPHQNPAFASHLSHKCYMPGPSHFAWFDRPNNFCWRLQIIQQPSTQEIVHFYGTRTFVATQTQAPSAGTYPEPQHNPVKFSQPAF